MFQYRRKRCRYCRQWFVPDGRVKNQQKSCGKEACRKARKKEAQKRWTNKNADYFKSRYNNTRDWLKRHPGYLEQYRKTHPEYVKKNRQRQKNYREDKSGLNYEQKRIVDIQDTIITQPIAGIKDIYKFIGVDIQDAINLQLVVPVYVKDNFISVDIQDKMVKALINKYTSNRFIFRQKAKLNKWSYYG